MLRANLSEILVFVASVEEVFEVPYAIRLPPGGVKAYP
jgi:hypothetical protein